MELTLRPADEQVVARLAGALRVRPATARCLVARGVVDAQGAHGFIDPRLAALRTPVGLAGLGRAVERLADAVIRGERIGVFGDYDVDGITTAALLATFLRQAGAEVEVAVARRDAGYGFTPQAAADLAERGCRLVVTGDCGTSDLAAIAAAAERGVEVIVVDHHTVPAAGAAHPAVALVNPLRPDSSFPFRGMASVGLAFYVAAAVRTELRDRGHFRERPDVDVRELLDLVALGTIADLVPLTEENRILTSLGLRRLASRTRPGLAALLARAGVAPDATIDARTVAWKLAPRLNAPGRLGAAAPSLALLLAGPDDAAACADALEEANTSRRALQDRMMDEALAMLGDADPGPCVVLAGAGWAPGVVGIVAAKLVDRFARPAFVVGVDPETGVGRGSARSAGGVNLYEALRDAAPLLARFGGHAAAAGFTVEGVRGARGPLAGGAQDAGAIGPTEDAPVEALRRALHDAVARQQLALGSGPVLRGREVDAEVRLVEVDERLAQELAGLGPFGQSNPAPVLATRAARVTAVRRVGDGSHLKLTVEDERGTTRGAIGFGLGERAVAIGDRLDLAFVPTISTWQGRRSAELELVDLAPSVAGA